MAAPHSYIHFLKNLQTPLKIVGNAQVPENTVVSFPNKETNSRYLYVTAPSFKHLRSLWDLYSFSRELDIVPHCLNETI